jgi:lambda family phage portal protein
VLHIHDPLESGQIRGLSKLTPAIVSLWMLDQYDDAELERKKTAALFSVFIKRQDIQPGFIDKLKEAQAATSAALSGNTGTATVDLQPGVAHVLFPGEDVVTSSPADVGPGYEAFQYRALTKFCAAVGLPYSSTTADTIKANYGSQRAAMLEMRRRMEALQHGVIVFQFCRPVANWFLDAAVMAGTLKLAGYARDPAPWRLIDWIAPPWDWIDPTKDITAEIMMIDAGIKPRSRTVQQTGYDPVESDNQIAADHQREKELDLTFVGASGPGKVIAQPPPEDGTTADDGSDDNEPTNDNVPNRKSAMLAFIRSLPQPVVNVQIDLPRKMAEKTTVTKHDADGRIMEFVRRDIDDDHALN